jgi:hypothetical protein
MTEARGLNASSLSRERLIALDGNPSLKEDDHCTSKMITALKSYASITCGERVIIRAYSPRVQSLGSQETFNEEHLAAESN